MDDILHYCGYEAEVGFDDQDGLFIGRIAGIRDGVMFHSDTVEGIRDAFHDAVDDYLETCARIGRVPQTIDRISGAAV